MKLILFISLLLLNPGLAVAQDSLQESQKEIRYDSTSSLQPVTIEAQQLEKFRNDNAFDYLEIEKQESWWTRLKNYLNLQYNKFLHWLFGDYEANSFLSVLFQILPYLIIGLIIGFVVWLFIRLDPGNRLFADPDTPDVYLNEEEKIVRSQNIPQLIQEAIEQKNYRLAIRFYYLQLLRQLDKKELINYESQKTNLEYLNEVKESYRQQLKNLIRIYDFSWYGEFTISEEHFQSVQKSFLEMEKSLNSGVNE